MLLRLKCILICFADTTIVCQDADLVVADPNGANCDAECGSLSDTNVDRWVGCRRECVLPDFTGLRHEAVGGVYMRQLRDESFHIQVIIFRWCD